MSVEPGGPARPAGLGAAVRRLLYGVAEIGRTRLELALLELEAERVRLERLLLRAAAGLLLLFLAVVMAVGAWLLHVAPEDRPVWAGMLALLFGVAAALVAWDGRRLARRRGPLLSTRWLPPARASSSPPRDRSEEP